MANIAIGIEYDGHAYSGWQRQSNNVETIQAHIESAISKIANEKITLYCAGRTDAGVHATGQVANFHAVAQRSDFSWLRGTNTYLPQDIAVRWVKQVDNDFHARFSTMERCYRYIIDNSHSAAPALNRLRATWIHQPIDEGLMYHASRYLLGEHDFSAFRSSQCQAKSPVKTLKSLEIRRHGNIIICDITANGFLHHMVRNIMGVLIKVGIGKASIKWCEEVLNSRQRRLAGVTARPDGLYLSAVSYPENFDIPRPMAGMVIV